MEVGGELVSGCVNLTGVLTAEVIKPLGESTVAKILELVENAASKKAQAENSITRFARVYTPAVVIGAVALALIPPIFLGRQSDWIHRALIFLVISCPRALVISIPLAFFGGIGGASRRGRDRAAAAGQGVTALADGVPVAARLGLDEIHAELMPADKVAAVESLLAKKSPKGTLAYIGDGVNGAPVLSRADVGVAVIAILNAGRMLRGQ